MTELEWRRLDWLPFYEISENGDLRRHTARRSRRADVVIRGFLVKGRRMYHVSLGDSKMVNLVAARLVCEAWHGPCPTDKHQCAHWDGDKRNDHHSNLRWATPCENSADRLRHGTDFQGEKHPCAKLSDAQIAEMRSLHRPGVYGSAVGLARQFGVSESHARNILSGRVRKPAMAITAAVMAAKS